MARYDEYYDEYGDSFDDMEDQQERVDYEDEEIEGRAARDRTSSERRVTDQEWQEEKERRDEEEFWRQQEKNMKGMQ